MTALSSRLLGAALLPIGLAVCSRDAASRGLQGAASQAHGVSLIARASD